MSETAHDHKHATSPLLYVAVLGALLFLTVVTVGAAYVNLGPLNIVLAMAIATLKATLVALFFMHLRHDPPVNGMIFVSSLIFLAIFISFTAIDINSRDRVVPYGLRVQAPLPGAAAPAAIPAPAAAPAHH